MSAANALTDQFNNAAPHGSAPATTATAASYGPPTNIMWARSRANEPPAPSVVSSRSQCSPQPFPAPNGGGGPGARMHSPLDHFTASGHALIQAPLSSAVRGWTVELAKLVAGAGVAGILKQMLIYLNEHVQQSSRLAPVMHYVTEAVTAIYGARHHLRVSPMSAIKLLSVGTMLRLLVKFSGSWTLLPPLHRLVAQPIPSGSDLAEVDCRGDDENGSRGNSDDADPLQEGVEDGVLRAGELVAIAEENAPVPVHEPVSLLDLQAGYSIEFPKLEKHQSLPLNSDEIKMLKHNFETSAYSNWAITFETSLELRNPNAGKLLQLTMAEAIDAIAMFKGAAEADLWLAAALRMICDQSTKKGELFIAELLEAERSMPGVSKSGVVIYERIYAHHEQRDVTEQEKEWDVLTKTEYIKLGMDETSVKLAIKKLSAQFSTVPAHYRNRPNGLLRAIVAAIPCEPEALRKEKDKYTRAFERAELQGKQPVLEANELNVESITAWIIIDVASHSTPVQKEVSAAEWKNEKEKKVLKGPCNVCGQDHHHFECDKTPCRGCKQRPCQGTRGMACWLMLEDIPVYTDFSGAKLHPKLQERFNGMRTAKGLPIPEISSLELCFMCDDESAVEAEVEPITTIQVVPLEISAIERVVSNVESSSGRPPDGPTVVGIGNMPVDSMTKWIKHDKMAQQLAYLINARHAVWPGS
jgi:hypothetical protein